MAGIALPCSIRTQSPKLKLDRETLQSLEQSEVLREAAGGLSLFTCVNNGCLTNHTRLC